MPEGDTVWNTAQALHRCLAGARLTASDFRVPQLATADLTGWTVVESACRGKHLLLRLVDRTGTKRLTLHSHLRMDGAWRTFRPGARWTPHPPHLIRVILRSADAVAVGYHLHEVALVRTADEGSLVGHLGPDLLGPDWDAREAARRLGRRPERTIAEALLDQTNLAGIGNLYKCELLFLHGIAPGTPVGEVPDLAEVAETAHRLLAANRGRWLQSTTGALRKSEANYVYGRAGRPCRRCGTTIRRADQADRITFWCPSCQAARHP